MSLDGIWVLELAGIYGWERVSTVFLEKGRYLGCGTFFLGEGTYVVKGKKVNFKVEVTQNEDRRTVFGEKRKHFSTEITAKRKGKIIQGKVRLTGSRSTVAAYAVRFKKYSRLPAFPK